MPRYLQVRAPGHGKIPNDPNSKLSVDPLAFLGEDPWAEMAEDILFGGLNTLLQIVDYATGLDLLPAAKMLEDAFVGSTLGGPAFDDFVSYLETQPTTDATTGLPTPSTTATGLFSALLRWLTLGFGVLDGSETLLSKLITAAGGTGSTLTEFGDLFTGLASVAVSDITGLATGVESWLVDGGSLPTSSSLGVDQLTGLAVGFEEWLVSGGPLPDATSIGVTQLSGLATGVESWLGSGGALPSNATAGISQILTLPGQLATMFSPFNPPHVIGTGQISNVVQNLLVNPTFTDANSMLGELVWLWDAATPDGIGGSAKVLANANANAKSLLSNPIQVVANDTVTASAYTQWDSLAYTGTPISLMLNLYDANNALINTVTLATATMTGATSSWVQLIGSHVITDTGAAWARLRYDVSTTATGGSVWFGKGSLTKPNPIPQDAVDGLLSLASQPQSIIDTGIQAVANDAGLIDQSLAVFNSQFSNLRDFIGYVTGGAAPVGSVANIASNVDNTVKARAVQKPPSANIDPTLDATFDFHQIWQNATLPTVSSTSGVTVMGDITIRDGGIKQAVTWYGYPSGGNFGSISDFRVNIWSVSKTNNVRTLVHSSANLVTTVGTGTAPVFNSYNLPTQITCAAGDKLTVELAILGSGTYIVVGQTLSAQVPVHPNYGLHALTRASATAPATVNPPGVGGSPLSYTRSVPLLGLSGVAAQTQYSPVIIPFYSSGSFDPSIYGWANNIDIVVCGPGGNGMNGSGYWGGYPGTPGGWAAATLTKAQWSTVTTSVNVTAGGSQTASSITVPGWGTIYGGAGTNGTQVSGTSNLGAPASGPGDEYYDGTTYHGGNGGGPPQTGGEQPGGGGAGGNAPFTVGTNIYGGRGGDGIGYIKVYQ